MSITGNVAFGNTQQYRTLPSCVEDEHVFAYSGKNTS